MRASRPAPVALRTLCSRQGLLCSRQGLLCSRQGLLTRSVRLSLGSADKIAFKGDVLEVLENHRDEFVDWRSNLPPLSTSNQHLRSALA